MPEVLRSVQVPLGAGGENSAAGPLGSAPNEVAELRNALITGAGAAEQAPDLLLAATGLNKAGSEAQGIAGIFPFATQGDAARPSAGVAFPFDLTEDRIRLAQLDEDSAILRHVD